MPPADYSSTAQALSLPTSTLSPSPTPSSSSSSASPAHSPISRSSSSSPFRSSSHHRQNGSHSSNSHIPVPPWARSSTGATTEGRGGPISSINSRRLSNPYSRTPRRSATTAAVAYGRRAATWSLGALNRTARLASGMSAAQQGLAALAGAIALTLLVLFLVYSHRIFAWLEPVAEAWRALPGGWLIVFVLTCATAFPPMIGYSTCLTVAGFVYGFPGGWPVVAAATVVGSTAAFAASRTVLSRYVHRLVGADKRFVALGQVLRHDGLWVLVGLRFCPLPFSLSNGFLATIPSITPWSFALATAIASPKLLVHVFVGSRLAKLAESGDKMSLGDRAINYLGMLFGVSVGMVVGVLVYRRTMARAEQLAREDLDAAVGGNGNGNGNRNSVDGRSPADVNYGDLEDGILGDSRHLRLDDEDDQAAIMSEDDISLWAQEGVADSGGVLGKDDDDEVVAGPYRDSSSTDGSGGGRYRDEFEEEEETGKQHGGGRHS